MVQSTGRLHVNYLRGFTIYQTQRLLKILLKSLNQDTRSAAQSNDQVAEDLAKSCIQKIMTMTISHVNDVRKRAAHREWWSEKMDDHPAARSLLEGQGSSAYSKRGVQFLENPNDHVPGIPRPTANRREQALRLHRDQITQLGGVNRSGFEKTLEDIPFPRFIELLQKIVEDIAAAYLVVKNWLTPDQVAALMLDPAELKKILAKGADTWERLNSKTPPPKGDSSKGDNQGKGKKRKATPQSSGQKPVHK